MTTEYGWSTHFASPRYAGYRPRWSSGCSLRSRWGVDVVLPWDPQRCRRIEFAALGVNGILHNLKQHQTIVKEFNIAEAPFTFFFYFDVCVIWWCSDGRINSQEYKSFEIHAVTIKISMTEYRHWIHKRSGSPFILKQQSMGEMSMVNLVTCLCLLSWST